ncbi:RNA polymerase, sigma 28 subunit, SigD/FliA/WhiG [Mariprofundus ferrinatatus]|uniref:RNA polymerase, sigma 28 subunit, SigD/FliA/WhiG n=1 Tax=Mariprofundus ferrinatatus TaxID=1921087 RepID=A0A2K8L6J1_9PROT|nr:FliA/WhiG family RNA polymerase sigma factor [Mariprofundus ferrinatatus]ATX82938.1 RNA polymerase, sigma 28 subunit, SigD/FliA/WhiG [Mariprofundus ferrinatatus]
MTTPYDKQASPQSQTPEQLLEAHLPLIRYHANQLIRRVPDSIEMDDLIDAGVLGLLDGAGRFNPAKNAQFKTFISYRIRGSMIDYLRAFDWMPRSLRDSSKELQQAMSILEQQYDRPVEEADVADHLGISLEEYRNRLMDVRSLSVIYFDDLPQIRNDDDASSIIDTISGDPEQMPDSLLEISDFTQRLAGAIMDLPVREKVLISLYYYEELNMKEVALVLDITESRVSQLHSQMVLRLRSKLGLDLPNG